MADSFHDIVKKVKNKMLAPVYLLHGEEDYFIDEICKTIDQQVLTPQEKEFNQTVVYGRDVDVPALLAMARRYPMMANHQVILVKEAQNLRQIEDLASYVEKPQPSTVLVLCYKHGKIDMRRKLAKALKKNKGVLYEAKKIYDNKVSPWIEDYVSSNGYSISPEAARMLAENLGNELSRVVNEIQKLFISLEPGQRITRDNIEQNIGISKEFNVFELQRALGEKNTLKANRIIFHFASDPRKNPAVMVIPMLYNYFINLMTIHSLPDKSQRSIAAALSINPFFVKEYLGAYRNYSYRKLIEIISLLRFYDMKAKGWNATTVHDGDIFKELIFKILH